MFEDRTYGGHRGHPEFVLRAAPRERERAGSEWCGSALAQNSRLTFPGFGGAAGGWWIQPHARPDTWINTMQANALAQAKAFRVSWAAGQRHLDACSIALAPLGRIPGISIASSIALFGSFLQRSGQGSSSVFARRLRTDGLTVLPAKS